MLAGATGRRADRHLDRMEKSHMDGTGDASLDSGAVARFADQVLSDAAACVSAALACVGDTLGLYRTMAEAGPVTARQLAALCDVAPAYADQWLRNQAAGGYVRFDPLSGHFSLPPEHATVLTDERSEHYLGQAFHAVQALLRTQPEVFQAGYEPVACCSNSQASPQPFLHPGAVPNLVHRWVPALRAVDARLREGALAAELDCGCGQGAIALAHAYPASHFFGFDSHPGLLRRAGERARTEGVAENTTFEPTAPESIPNHRYALIVARAGLSGMHEPGLVACRARRTLDPGGSLLLVEPNLHAAFEEDLNPIGRLHAALGALRRFQGSRRSARAEEPPLETESGLRALLGEAGFAQVAVVDETRFARVFEARA
jgi:SAM-dependent methyltransferase